MTTHANINGANITRLRFQQMHTNTCHCVLMQPPVADAESSRYIAAVENLIVSTDIPIFKRDTVAFTVVDVMNEDEKIPEAYAADDDFKMPETDNLECRVGPVYSFSDFIHQVQTWCNRYNRDTALTGEINVDAQLATRKIFGLRGNHLFWGQHIIVFSTEVGRIFEGLLGADEFKHIYLFSNNGVAARTKVPLIGEVVNIPQPVAQKWLQNTYEFMYTQQDGTLQDWLLGDFVTISMPCKLDMFENRVGLQIDSVLPLPLELFVMNSNEQERNKGASRYNFITLDFPEGSLQHTTRLGGSSISDDIDIKQQVRTGLFQLVPNSHNSVAKKLMSGSLQSQRYELLLIRKVPQADGSVKLVPEPVDFSNGDFWSMDVVFTKQI